MITILIENSVKFAILSTITLFPRPTMVFIIYLHFIWSEEKWTEVQDNSDIKYSIWSGHGRTLCRVGLVDGFHLSTAVCVLFFVEQPIYAYSW